MYFDPVYSCLAEAYLCTLSMLNGNSDVQLRARWCGMSSWVLNVQLAWGTKMFPQLNEQAAPQTESRQDEYIVIVVVD